jgi:DNA polymerase-3 subunit alpha
MTNVEIILNNVEEFEQLEILAFEKETLGFYVSGHPLDKYREQIENIKYTLSSDLDELGDGSEAILVGKIEEIQERISKKGNKFGIATLLDLHGNIELMLFEKHIKMLEERFNIERPIAFKVRISKTDDFTRMSILKIETLEDATKEKVKVKKEEKYTPEPDLPPIIIAINLMPDSRIAEELMCLAQRHPGKHPLSLKVRSKLADVVIESKVKVSKEFINEVVELGFDIEEAS